MAGLSLIRPKNKSEDNKNIVETSEPENEKEESTQGNKDNYNQSVPNSEPTEEIEKKQNELEMNMPTTELEKSTVDEMKTITNRTKEKLNCENCERTFGTPLFMYDYSEGKRNLVGCCPYCSQIIGKQPNKKLKETENVAAPEIEKLTRLQEKVKKRETMVFQITSDDLDELIKNTAYVR